MKSYTDLKQSKNLSNILPLTSADIHYERAYFEGKQSDWFIALGRPIKSDDIIPCWSLVALMGILDNEASFKTPQGWTCHAFIWPKAITSNYNSNPIDACYEIILKLKEMNLI